MSNERRVPDAVQITRVHRPAVVGADGRSKRRDKDAVAATLHPERMEGLMEVGDQVHEELERDGPVGAVERGVCQTFLVVANPVDDAITPSVAATVCGNLRLAPAITGTVGAPGVCWNIDEMPEGRLILSFEVLISPYSHIGEPGISKEPSHVPLRRPGEKVRSHERAESSV